MGVSLSLLMRKENKPAVNTTKFFGTVNKKNSFICAPALNNKTRKSCQFLVNGWDDRGKGLPVPFTSVTQSCRHGPVSRTFWKTP